jgi:hypothetical protein
MKMADLNTVTIRFGGKDYNFFLNPKTFSTGSKGFYGYGRIQVSQDEKYTVNIMLVKVGSKLKVK